MTSPAQERPPYLWALGTFLVVFVIYFVTLAPTTAFWDTSEYIAAARVLGIPHPPGNPLFVILAHTFGLLPLAASYAERINLFAAVTSAAAAGLWFLVAERWLQGIVRERWARYAAAFGGVLVGATSWSVWNQSTVNEKVYTVSLFSIALVMWLVVRWGDDAPGPHRDRWLVLIAYVLALTSTNHLMGLLAVPALVVYVLWTDWRVITRPTVLVGIVLAAVVGVSLNYLWLPMRAAQYPPINEGEPIGFFSQALKDVLNRVQYGKPGLGERQASFAGQLGTFWQYYSWQFARDWGRLSGVATAVFTVLGVSGLWALWKSDRRAGLAGLALVGTLSLGLVFYMNFKYGFSQYPDQPSLPREVRERDYFFIGSFAVYGAFVACGLGALMQSIVDGLRDRGSATARWAAASPVLLLAFIPHVRQPRHRQPRPRDDGPRLRLRHPQQRGAVRHPDHRGRQRHLPAVVRPGGRGHPPGHHAGQPVAHEHRLAPAPARPAGDPGLRSESRGSDLARRARAAPSHDAGAGPDPGGGRQPARGDAGAQERRHRLRQPPDPLRAGRPAAAGSRHHLPHPGQPGEAADLLQLERWRVSRPDARAEPVPGLPGLRPEAHADAGPADRDRAPESRTRLRRRAAHAQPAEQRVPLADGDARSGRSAGSMRRPGRFCSSTRWSTGDRRGCSSRWAIRRARCWPTRWRAR